MTASERHLRDWWRKWQDVVTVVYGGVLLALAAGLVFVALQVRSQSSHTARVANVSCMRSIKYGPYLAALYARDLDPGPRVFRVMPPDAAKAYADSIPKHC